MTRDEALAAYTSNEIQMRELQRVQANVQAQLKAIIFGGAEERDKGPFPRLVRVDPRLDDGGPVVTVRELKSKPGKRARAGSEPVIRAAILLALAGGRLTIKDFRKRHPTFTKARIYNVLARLRHAQQIVRVSAGMYASFSSNGRSRAVAATG